MVYVWIYEHRFGNDVFLFKNEATEEQVIKHIEEVTGTETELDRDDEWLTEMGKQEIVDLTS